MYQTFKNILIGLVPKKILFSHEENFRKIYALFYGGTKYACNVCGKKLSRFITTQNNDLLCPNCGSLQRNRRLWQLLETEFLKPGQAVLDFSPSRCLYRKMKKIPAITYHSTDLSGDFIADYRFDITRLDIADNTYDLVICYHILEHIPDDIAAMRELFRVMKPGAKALVQTPFKEGAIYEDARIVSEKERLEHFGQEDHVRIYSVSGLQSRLKQCGFLVEMRQNPSDGNNFGLNPDEKVLILTKI